MSARYPELTLCQRKFAFLDGLSLDELSFRSYEFHLLVQFVAENQVETPVRQWDRTCETILAALALKHGFSNFKAFARHPVWLKVGLQEQNQA